MSRITVSRGVNSGVVPAPVLQANIELSKQEGSATTSLHVHPEVPSCDADARKCSSLAVDDFLLFRFPAVTY
jgi:hypothetical protein